VVALLTAPGAQSVGAQRRQTALINGHEVVAGEALVKFRTPPLPGDVEQAVDADRNEGIGGHGVRRVHSKKLGTAALVAALARRSDVEYAEPNYIVRADVLPNDPSFAGLWGLVNTGQTVGQSGTPGADISADAAWDLTKGSKANVVAIVDTGFNYNHPDLAANAWSAPSSFTVTIGGRNITCAAGTHGFNAIAQTCDPLDDNNHGTHVAGTIGAVGNNGVGVTGVNWVASLMGAKFLDSTGSGTTADAVDAIAFVIQAKLRFGALANVRVLSNSWGGPDASQALLDEIKSANAADMLFVAAAGNNGTNNDTSPYYPANYAVSNVLAVAATDNRDALASFSNYGASMVELGAPGVNILSTLRTGGYGYLSGTSMAAPHVSGGAALVLSYCPALSTSQLVSTILGTVDQVSSLAARTYTGGRLNVHRALTACGTQTTPTPDFSLAVAPSSLTMSRGSNGQVTVTISRTGGFTNAVGFSASVPKGVTASFSPASATGNASTMTLTAGGSARKGTSKVVITGKSGTLIRSATLQLTVR
jgi:subtilisin family serine protease